MTEQAEDVSMGSSYYKRASELHDWAKLISADMTDDVEKADARRVLRMHINELLEDVTRTHTHEWASLLEMEYLSDALQECATVAHDFVGTVYANARTSEGLDKTAVDPIIQNGNEVASTSRGIRRTHDSLEDAVEGGKAKGTHSSVKKSRVAVAVDSVPSASQSDPMQEVPIDGKQTRASRRSRRPKGKGKQRAQSGDEYDSGDSEASVPLSIVKASQAINTVDCPHVYVKDKSRVEQVVADREFTSSRPLGDHRAIQEQTGTPHISPLPPVQATLQDQIAHGQRVASQALVLASQEAMSRDAVSKAVIALVSDNHSLRTKNQALLKRVKTVEDAVTFVAAECDRVLSAQNGYLEALLTDHLVPTAKAINIERPDISNIVKSMLETGAQDDDDTASHGNPTEVVAGLLVGGSTGVLSDL